MAVADIARLADFLEKKNPRAANAAVDAILDGMALLAEMPLRGPASPGGFARRSFVRFGTGGYILKYSVQGDEVLILRIFHALEDR